MYVLGPCGSLSNEVSCEAGNFSCCLTPTSFFQSKVLRLSFLMLESWVARSVSLPICSSQFICTQIWDSPLWQPPPCPIRQLPPCPPWSSSHCLATLFPPPSCPSPPLLPVWMNVSSLAPWLSDFHTVQFSGSSRFLFLNLLLSLFWLCKEAKCIYLHLHLGWKSSRAPFKLLHKGTLPA